MKKIVAIEPFPTDKVYGDFSYSGDVHKMNGGKKEKFDSFLGAQALNISGLGCILDLDDPDQERIYKAITEGLEIKHAFSYKTDGKRGASQRFRIRDEEKEVEEFIKLRSSKKKLEEDIDAMKESGKLKNFALVLGVSGSENVVYANVLKMLDTPEGIKKVSKYINHNDRQVIELIHLAISKGNANEKEGVWKAKNEMYYINDVPMGLGLDQAVAFLKKEENANLYQALKDSILQA